MQAKILGGHNLRRCNCFLTGDMDHVRRGQGVSPLENFLILASKHTISMQFGRDRNTLTELAATLLYLRTKLKYLFCKFM